MLSSNSEPFSLRDPSHQQDNPNKQEIIAEFKIVLVGDSEVGKSTFLDRFESGEKTHDTTNGADIRSVTFQTNMGRVKLNIWESSMKVGPGELKEEIILGADFGIIMFAFDSRMSYKNSPDWLKALRKIREDLPVVLIGNKVDIVQKKVKGKHVYFHLKKNLLFNYISSKANFNIERPFVSIMKQLIGSQDLELVEAPQMLPPELMIPVEQIKGFDTEFTPYQLSDDDDDLCKQDNLPFKFLCG